MSRMGHTTFDLVWSAAAVASLALGLVLAVGPALRRRDPATAVHVLRGFAAAVALSCVAAAAAAPFGLRVFGAMRIVYVALVVVVPLVGAAALALAAFGRIAVTRAAAVAASCGLAAAGVGAWATLVEPYRLVVERTSVPVAAERGGSGDVRVGVLADLQADRIGPYEHGAVDRLLAEAPDVILIPGDLFQGWSEEFAREFEPLRALLGRLDAPGGVYFVRGDVDVSPATDRLFTGTKVRYLRDEVVRVPLRGRVLEIGGISSLARGPDLFPGPARVVDRLERRDGDEVRILVAHPPDIVLALPRSSRIDLVVAGHTHGGQVVVPGFGPPVTLSSVPRAVAAGGLHTLDGRRIYVSRGVGMERVQAPRLRLFCPPEISVLTLTSGSPPP